MEQNLALFLILVAGAVFLLSVALTTPVFGESKKNRAKLRARLQQIRSESETSAAVQLLRESHLKDLSPWERELESTSLLLNMSAYIQQAGYTIPAYRLILISVVLALVGFFFAFIITAQWWGALLAAALGAGLPFMKIARDRNQRMEAFEAALPDALDIMKRALQAGHPLSESMHLVSVEMEGPVAEEFETTFNDINYGNSLRNSLLGLLERIPSVTVMALITSIIVQKETGGNMAEIFDKLAKLIRGRYRFQRRVRTLSAEGRISAWVLCLVPFALFFVISVTTPTYLPVLFIEPLGQKMLIVAGVGMVIGIFVIRKIIRIEV